MVDQIGIRFVAEGAEQAIQAIKNYRKVQTETVDAIKAGQAATAGFTRDLRTLLTAYQGAERASGAYKESLREVKRQIAALTGVSIQAASAAVEKLARDMDAAMKAVDDDAARRAFEQIRASVDPATAAVERFQAAMQKVDAALARGVITPREFSEVSGRLQVQRDTALDAPRAEAAAAYDRLRAAIDPTAAAAQKLAAAQKTVDAAIRQGVVTAEQGAQTMRALQKGLEDTGKANELLRRETQQLAAVYNPVMAAQMAFTTRQEELNRALEVGVLSADRYADEMRQLQTAFSQVGNTTVGAARFMNQYGESVRFGGVSTNRFGMYAQQVGYQVGDFFVQIQSGTNAFVAFGQQATQLAGLLPGLLGAVLGIGISVGTALLSMWSRTRDATDDAGAATKRYEEALKSLREQTASTRDEMAALFAGFEGSGEGAILNAISRREREMRDVGPRMMAQLEESRQTDASTSGVDIPLAPETIAAANAEIDKQVAALRERNKTDLEQLETLRRQREELRRAQAISDRTRETQQENRLIQAQLGLMQQGVEAAEARKLAEDALLVQQANVVATSANATDEQRAFAAQLTETLGRARQLAAAMESSSQAQNLTEQNRQQEMLLGYLQSGMTLSQAQAAVTRENAQAEMDRLEALAQSVVANTELSAAARAAGQALLDAVMNARQLAPALDAATRNAGALEAAAQRIANAFAAVRSAMLNLGTQELETQAALGVAKAGGDAIEQNLARAKVRARAEMKDLFGAQDAAIRATAPKLLEDRFSALERNAATERQLAAQNAANQRSGSGAGTGGGAAQFVSMFPELQAAYTRAAEMASQYKQEVEILDSALARGMITQQQYNTFLESAQAAYEQSALASEELMKRQDELAQRLGNTLGNLFVAATNGADAFRSALSNVLSSLASMLANAAFTQLLKSSGGGLLDAVSKFVGAVLPSADGNVFMGGNVVPFANGGVVSGPTMFPMRNGTGLMGEAGPEAIMPLRRGRDGRLGVAAAQTQAAPVDVRVFVDQDGNWQAKVERIADRRVRQQAPTLVRQSVQAVYSTNEERKLR